MNPNPQRGRTPFYSGRAEKGPCWNCQKRHPACHDKCPEYQAYKTKSEEQKAIVRKRRDEDLAINEFKAKQTLKISHKKPKER